MVLYFTSTAVDPPATIYMGRDKFENEDLIAHGWEEDVWFHVDKLSSAHVYLRMPEGMLWDAIPEPLLLDLAQLTKANSIEGNKMNNITVLYTPWSNLKKTSGMETGQVTFHNQKKVKKVFVDARRNEIVNRLNKTKVVAEPDLAAEKIERDRKKRAELRKAEKLKVYARGGIDEQRKLAEQRDYKTLFTEENMRTNRQIDEDDFM
ncbi:hypothetical protein DFJ73DRAFT_789209 [Zopfochytrium polystomum]|nr:hypothetical protein DFJ73DRAFT_789209 [Zopfochytrium polystomum]